MKDRAQTYNTWTAICTQRLRRIHVWELRLQAQEEKDWQLWCKKWKLKGPGWRGQKGWRIKKHPLQRSEVQFSRGLVQRISASVLNGLEGRGSALFLKCWYRDGNVPLLDFIWSTAREKVNNLKRSLACLGRQEMCVFFDLHCSSFSETQDVSMRNF